MDDIRYRNIKELINEVNELGDWKNQCQRKNFIKVLAKVTALYEGYNVVNKDGEITKKDYQKEVLDAVIEVCKVKFPTTKQVYTQSGKFRGNYPDYAEYLTYVGNNLGISIMGERSKIYDLVEEELDIDLKKEINRTSNPEEIEQFEDSCKDYLEKRVENSNIPYYEIAKKELMNVKGLSEDDAMKIVNDQKLTDIDKQIGIKTALDNLIEKVGSKFDLQENDMIKLRDYIYRGEKEESIKNIKDSQTIESEIESKSKDNNVVIEALFEFHNGYVRDNFGEISEDYKKMPCELMGWEETKKDLEYIEPIFEKLGIEVNEAELEEVYNGKVKDFFLDKKIEAVPDLIEAIAYDYGNFGTIYGTEWAEEYFGHSKIDYVSKKVIPSIEENGIGDIDAKRKEIVSSVIESENEEDIEKLSEFEKSATKMNSVIGIFKPSKQEKDTEEQTEQEEKNNIIQRIKALIKKRQELKKEIAIEQQKSKENTQNMSK